MARHTMINFLIFGILFLATLSICGSTELDSEGVNVCGPRRVQFNMSSTVREVVVCPTGSCTIYRTEFYVTTLNVFYCCPGFSQTDRNCSEACNLGHFGENCTEICNCTLGHCHSVSGECQCVAGKQNPPNCTDDCSKGTFGVGCIGECDCQEGEDCDPVDGTCKQEVTTVLFQTTDTDNINKSQQDQASNQNTVIIIVCTVIPVVILIVVIVAAVVWKFYVPRVKTAGDNTHVQNTETSDGNNGDIATGNRSEHRNESYDNVLPPRASTGAQVELDPKYTAVQIPESKPSDKSKQTTDGQPDPSKGLPTYAKVNKSQAKSTKSVRAGAKPPTAQKPLSKSKTLPAKGRSYSESNVDESKSPPPTYASIEETLESRRKSDTLPTYASIGDTFSLGDDADISRGLENASGGDSAYDLLNPETMNSLLNPSKQESSAPTQSDSSPYDVPAAGTAAASTPAALQNYSKPNSTPAPHVPQTYASPNSAPAAAAIRQTYASPNSSPPPPSASQKSINLEAAAYGVTDLRKKDLSLGEIEVQQKSTTIRLPLRDHLQNGEDLTSGNHEVSGINHHYATLESPDNNGI